MKKYFLPFDTIRDNAILISKKIIDDGFEPDVIYCGLRGGTTMANVIDEYFGLAFEKSGKKKPFYAAVRPKSYQGVKAHGEVSLEGWTLNPETLDRNTKILFVDDIFDSGNTINKIVGHLVALGFKRENIKVVVHDYKVFKFKDIQHPVQPDYWCRKFEIENPDDDFWIHYMSHELSGLTKEEVEENYLKKNPALKDAFGLIFDC